MSPLCEHSNDEDGALIESLSPRERQLLEMATNGLTDQAISKELGISLATVSTYWGRIRIKFGPLGRTEIVARFLKALMSRATADLTASEERMRTVLEASPVGIFLTDGEGRPVYVNAAYAAIAGRRESELVQEGLASLVFPEDRSHAQANRERCLTEGTSYVSEHRWVRGDGTVVWVRLRSAAWYHEGKIAGRVGVVEDVTQEHEARERQTEAEEQYRLLFALAPEAIVSVDDDLKIVGFNVSAERMFGYALDEILGQPLAVLIPGRFRAAHPRFVRAFGQGTTAVARPMAARSEVRGLRKDGSEFPCEASIVRQMLKGRPHYTAIVRDVADRVRPETTERSRTLDALPTPAWRIDNERVVVEINGAAADYIGKNSASEAALDEEGRLAYGEALASGKEVRLRLRRGHDGALRWHRCRAHSQRDGWTVVFWDVHELETAADDLRRIRTVLGTP